MKANPIELDAKITNTNLFHTLSTSHCKYFFNKEIITSSIGTIHNTNICVAFTPKTPFYCSDHVQLIACKAYKQCFLFEEFRRGIANSLTTLDFQRNHRINLAQTVKNIRHSEYIVEVNEIKIKFTSTSVEQLLER